MRAIDLFSFLRVLRGSSFARLRFSFVFFVFFVVQSFLLFFFSSCVTNEVEK